MPKAATKRKPASKARRMTAAEVLKRGRTATRPDPARLAAEFARQIGAETPCTQPESATAWSPGVGLVADVAGPADAPSEDRSARIAEWNQEQPTQAEFIDRAAQAARNSGASDIERGFDDLDALLAKSNRRLLCAGISIGVGLGLAIGAAIAHWWPAIRAWAGF